MISGQQAALEPNALGSALIILLTTSTNSNQKKSTHQSCKLATEKVSLLKIDLSIVGGRVFV